MPQGSPAQAGEQREWEMASEKLEKPRSLAMELVSQVVGPQHLQVPFTETRSEAPGGRNFVLLSLPGPALGTRNGEI